MYLKRAVLVNWGNVPHLEFEFGPINLFSGGNGSGKTTAADAIQTLMTAAHENLFNYNPGQDETTQKGRGGKQVRTLASYVLGCDDGSYARPFATDGYIAGIFHPTQGESSEPFTALMCMRAHLDCGGKQKQARLDELMFVILPTEQLSLSHLVRNYPDGKHVVPITEITTLLKKEFGAKTVELYDKKGAYLRRLYGALRGKRDAVFDREAKHAARTLSNFMAYKPVKSINEFVAQEILKPIDLGDAIRNVSELMKTIHHMEADTRAICDSINTLTHSRDYAEQYIHHWQERALTQFTGAKHRVLTNQKAYLAAKSRQQITRDDIDQNAQTIRNCEQKRQQTHGEMVRLEAARQGINALKTKDELERTLAQHNQQLVELTRPLLEQGQQLDRNRAASESLLNLLKQHSLGASVAALNHKECLSLAKACAASEANIDMNQLLAKDWVGGNSLEQQLHTLSKEEAHHRAWANYLYQGANGTSVRDQVADLRQQTDRKRQDLNTKLKQKQKDIQRLQAQRVSYPPYVDVALAAIRKQIPAADPQVLCDFIEVLDERWQMAIEGYIGGARFSLLVAPEYEAQAICIVRSLPDAKRNRARVIQGYKAQRDAERLSLPKNSIVEVMEFNHKIAEYYIKASYGSVLRVDDAEQLRATARGITPEGLGSGNYTLWRCDLDEGELVFGQGARERALAAKERELEAITINSNNVEQDYLAVARALELIDSIKPTQATKPLQMLVEIHHAIEQTEAQLQRLDLRDYQALENQLTELKSQYSSLDQDHRHLVEEAGRLKELVRQNDRKVTELADAADAIEAIATQLEQAVAQISQWQPDFNADAALQTAEAQAQTAPADFNFDDEVETLTGLLDRAERELYQSILSHNQRCQNHDSIVYDTGMSERHSEEFFRRVLGLQNEVQLIRNRLQNNVLVDKYEKLTQLKDNFNTAFVTNLCHSIYQAIGEGKRSLEELNQELEHHRFGADRERFYFGYEWVPEFREYQRFFKEVIDLPNLGDGSSLFDAELSDKACAVRDNLLSMLLDPDEQVAMRELSRISDYRNYRFYEIYKEPEGKAPIALSQYGTGSGGQLETPAYIIRAAAVTSAFRFNEGNSHLRMVLVDEAFSKMDEARSREVIHYLTERLGLQLIFIMPTSKSGPFMDLISNQFVFSKCPTEKAVGELKTRVLVDRKECNQEKIKTLWANHRKTVRHQGLLDFMEMV